MKFKQISISALLFAMAVVTLPVLEAQTMTTGDVSGVVSDQSGAVLPSATVTLTNKAVGSVQTTTTNGQGGYHFALLPSGAYTVSASTPGLASDTVRITVEIGQAANINLTAKIQSTTQTVEVNGEVQAVQTENANLSRTFDAAQLAELPAPGGDITSVAFTTPGITVNTGGGYGNFSSHGLPGTANLFTINGNDYNDPYLNLNNSGASNLLLGQNDVSEASVVQNAYSVEYGRNAGAQVNFVTKSGSNNFHGDLFENYNGTLFNANDFFNNTNGLPTPHAVSNQYGANFGGRILKDKLFFFTDFEGFRYVLPTAGYVTLLSPQLQQYMESTLNPAQLAVYNNAFSEFSGVQSKATPTTNGTGPLQDANGNLGCADFAGTANPAGGVFGVNVPCTGAYATNANNLNTEWLMTDRVDYNVSDKNKVYFRFKVDHGDQATGTNLVNSAFNVSSVQPQYEGQINWTTIASPTVVNNFIGSVLWYSALFSSPNIKSLEQTNPFDLYDLVGGINATGGAGLYQLGFGYGGIGYDVFPQGRNSGQLGLVDDLSIVKGKHTIKLGANFRKNDVSDDSLQINAAGSYFFTTFTDFVQGVTNPNTGSEYTQSYAPISVAHIRLYNIGLYLQDEWNIKSNLKLTYGLRMERTGNPTCVEDCFSRLVAPFNTGGYTNGIDTPYNQTIETGLQHAYGSTELANFDPRIGIVWSPFKSTNSTVIRAGGGLFSDLPPGGIVASVFENQPFLYTANVFNGSEVGLASDPNSATAGGLAQYSAFKSGFASGQTLAQLNNSVPGGFGPINFFSTPGELKTPEYLEWSFEIQQPIGNKNVFVATYAGNHGYNLFLINPFVNTSVNTAVYSSFGDLPLSAPDPRFAAVSQLANVGVSNYDGLSLQFRRSFSYGFQGQIGYTWSHALDDISSLPGEPFNFNNSLTTQTTPIAALNYSNSDTDIRHSLVADFTWDSPWKPSSRAMGYLLGGWTLAGKFYARSGSPFSVVAGNGISGPMASTIGAGGTILADVLNPNVSRNCGASAVSSPCFQSTDFACPIGSTGCTAQTDFGNLPRNSFYGPGYFDIDTTLAKSFSVTEHAKFKLIVQAYNLLNHPNFANPFANVSDGAFGTIFSTVSAPTSPYGSFQGSAVSGRVLTVGGRFEF